MQSQAANRSLQFSIRPAGVADHETILRVWRSASRTGHPFLSAFDLDRQELLTRKYHLPRASILVAEADGEIEGFIAHSEEYIGALFVSPSAQNRGVGRALLLAIQGRCDALVLDVYEANQRACLFYKRMGFVEVRRSDRDHDRRPFPILTMAWARS